MTNRTIIAVVSDLLITGLTVEQQILVNELALAIADAQRKNDVAEAIEAGKELALQERRAKDAERMRALRFERSERSEQKERSPTPPKENNPLVLPTVKHSPACEPLFEEFWLVYPRKVAKGAAKKAYRHALTRASHVEILAGAKRYAASKPELKFTAHPASWLNADRWLDEPENVINFHNPPKRSWAEIKAERNKGHV